MPPVLVSTIDIGMPGFILGACTYKVQYKSIQKILLYLHYHSNLTVILYIKSNCKIGDRLVLTQFNHFWTLQVFITMKKFANSIDLYNTIIILSTCFVKHGMITKFSGVSVAAADVVLAMFEST
jgi:hypothetical protein